FAERPAPSLAAGTAPAPDLAAPGPGDYPHFLGPERDQRLSGPTLARGADATARLRWRRPIGAGWSACALRNGVGVTMEQDDAGQHVLAFALADGATLWRTRIDERFEHGLGGDGPRATPAIAAGRVFAHSAFGVLVALDGASGAELWRHDLVREFGLERAREAELAQYGRASSPLVAGERVIVPAGGDPDGARAGLAAYDAASGALLWTSPPRHFSYATPSLGRLLGREVVLAVNEASLSAHALASGELLFEHPWPGRTSGAASASQARVLDEEHVFLSKGYGVGGALLCIAEEGGQLVPSVVWHAPRLLRTKFTNVVVAEGFVYGLDDGFLECVALATGERRWKEGRHGHGQILAIGDTLLVLGEDGTVSAVELSPERANEVRWSFQALEGKCWAHPALAGNLLVVRNAEECAAWELPLAP
ncbi:MAG: PQQ-binding-like beta-propeller repeat protein, partial [Planctomycetota bacterium]